MVRTFTAEREIPFHLILDTSASMGAPSRDKKFGFATDLTAALSYIVLSSNNTLRIAALSSPEKSQRPFWATPFLRHRNRFLRVPLFLNRSPRSGKPTSENRSRPMLAKPKSPGWSSWFRTSLLHRDNMKPLSSSHCPRLRGQSHPRHG